MTFHSPMEHELKLKVAEQDFEALKKYAVETLNPKDSIADTTQRTTYFDTSDLALMRAGLAFRLREAQGKTVQSVKQLYPLARDTAIAAMARHEWEWPVDSGNIDTRGADVLWTSLYGQDRSQTLFLRSRRSGQPQIEEIQ